MDTQTKHPAEMKGDPNARYSFKRLAMGEAIEIKEKCFPLRKYKVNLYYDKITIATVYGIDKMEALDNASRFVQATDMHDELIKMTKEFHALLTIDLGNDKINKTRDSLLKQAPELNGIIKRLDLLKQSEQK